MPKEAFKALIDIVKPVIIERYTKTKIYLFQLREPIMLYLYSGDPFSCNLFNPFHATDLFWYPENIRKLRVFWCFQGLSKEIIGMKWVKMFWSPNTSRLGVNYLVKQNNLYFGNIKLQNFAFDLFFLECNMFSTWNIWRNATWETARSLWRH